MMFDWLKIKEVRDENKNWLPFTFVAVQCRKYVLWYSARSKKIILVYATGARKMAAHNLNHANLFDSPLEKNQK